MSYSTVLETILLASRYVAAAQLSFKNDGSSDKQFMLYSKANKSLISQPLNNEGVRLAINLEYGSIDVLHPEYQDLASYPLLNARHLDVVNWLERERQLLGFESDYDYSLIQQLGEDLPADSFSFQNVPTQHFRELSNKLDVLEDLSLRLEPFFDQIDQLSLALDKSQIGFRGYFDEGSQKADEILFTVVLTNDGFKVEVTGFKAQKEIKKLVFDFDEIRMDVASLISHFIA